MSDRFETTTRRVEILRHVDAGTVEARDFQTDRVYRINGLNMAPGMVADVRMRTRRTSLESAIADAVAISARPVSGRTGTIEELQAWWHGHSEAP